MRRILLAIFTLLTLGLQAQVCVPGTQTSTAKGYILPDSATNLQHGCAGYPYTQIMYIKAPPDTTFQISLGTVTADIDSFVIGTNITGLPAYLSANSVPAPLLAAGASFPKSNMERLVVPGDSLACVNISGNVPGGTASGNNFLNINVRAYLSNLHSPDNTVDFLLGQIYQGRVTDTLVNLNYYNIIIDAPPCYPQATQHVEHMNFQLIGCVPNPFNEQTVIQFESSEGRELELRILNALGQLVTQRKIHAQKGDNRITLNTSAWQTGLYHCTLSDGKQQQGLKMVVR